MPESSSSTDSVPDGHVIVGRVGKPHGLKGDFFVFPHTDHPDRFAPQSELFVDGRSVTVASSRTAEGRLIVRLSHITGRQEAEAIRGSIVTIPESSRRSLDDDEWWPDELVGLRVLDHAGEYRGEVIDFVEGVAQDRLLVRVDGSEVEVPFVKAVVPVVDVDAGHIRLADIEGLLSPQ